MLATCAQWATGESAAQENERNYREDRRIEMQRGAEQATGYGKEERKKVAWNNQRSTAPSVRRIESNFQRLNGIPAKAAARKKKPILAQLLEMIV